jgi:rhamnosyl/mannosyltransferase
LRLEKFEQDIRPRFTLAVGRLIYYKGFEVLLDAFRRVPGSLMLAGDGPLRGALELRALKNGIAERVHFLGPVPNEALGPYYGAADAFVLSSIARSEAFGIVQIEALGAGLPVINTALDSGVPEVSLSGVTGLTVPPNDVGALTTALNEIFTSPLRATEFRKAARARALRYFTHDRMTDETLAAYRAAIAQASFALSSVPAT